jgi:hypothetical protein
MYPAAPHGTHEMQISGKFACVDCAEREDLIGFIPGSKDLFYSAEAFVRPCHQDGYLQTGSLLPSLMEDRGD